jgi:hypothetical protein
MKSLNSIILTIFLAFAFACSQPDIKHDNSVVNSTSDTSNADQLSEMTNPHEDNIDGFTFKYGYLKYDEEKYGFSNPGFLKIYKDDKLVFSDSFKGEGSVDIESLGHHDLQGDKLVFRLNYGTEACDYVYTSKYYFIDKDQFKFLKECYSITGGDQYSSKFYEHIFPTDSAGRPNSMLIVEGQIFHEKDQPDRFDTTFIKFEDNKFKINKPTDNLSKVK